MAVEPGRQFSHDDIIRIQGLSGFSPSEIKYDDNGPHVSHEDRGYKTVYRGLDEVEHSETGDTWPSVQASQTGDFHGMTFKDLIKHHDEFVDDHESSPEYLEAHLEGPTK